MAIGRHYAKRYSNLVWLNSQLENEHDDTEQLHIEWDTRDGVDSKQKYCIQFAMCCCC